MYSNIIKRSFQMLKKADSYIEMDNGISKLINLIKSIDNGGYFSNIENRYPDFDTEKWISEHQSETFLGRGQGVVLPIDKDCRLLVLLKIFKNIQNHSFQDYIDQYYSEDVISKGMDLIMLLSGVYTSLKGDPRLNFENIEHLREKEKEKVKLFNEKISSEFERVLLDDIEIKYSRNKTKIIMGDNFENISNSTIVNKGVLFNVIKKENNKDLNDILIKLGKIVEESNNEDAIGSFNDLLWELSEKTPKKRRLNSFWNGLVEALPHIKDLTDIYVGINTLIS